MEKKSKMNRRQAIKVAGGVGLGAMLAGLQLPEALAQAVKKGKKGGKKAAGGLKFHHIGVPTQAQHENERFLADSKVYITDPEKDKFGIEWCRWLPDSPADVKLRTTTHIAFQVDDVEKEIAKYDEKMVFAKPFVPFEGVKVAFIDFEGLLVEFLQKTA